ncbi:hypothetical protein AB0A98_37355 [Streptomyces chrestomyceticus]|uniref:hypothetical protein n=1 Tax=Streptomyces chrestomyceticus TaxID=68185 RepID=UPI0033D63F74
MTGEIPAGTVSDAAFAAGRGLLRAEAERRGVPVAVLVDDLARASRRHPLLAFDPQPSATVRRPERGAAARGSRGHG